MRLSLTQEQFGRRDVLAHGHDYPRKGKGKGEAITSFSFSSSFIRWFYEEV